MNNEALVLVTIDADGSHKPIKKVLKLVEELEIEYNE